MRTFIFFAVVGVLVVALGLAAKVSITRVNERTKDDICRARMTQLGVALSHYRATFGCFPPPYLLEDGIPIHSWRVLILPFCDLQDVYEQYDFTRPWNSAHNMAVCSTLNKLPGGELFRCPADVSSSSTSTSVLAVVNRGVAAKQQMSVCGLRSLVVEVSNSGIEWSEPRDLTLEAARNLAPHHSGGIRFLAPSADELLFQQNNRRAFLNAAASSLSEPEDPKCLDSVRRNLHTCLKSSSFLIRHGALLLLSQLGARDDGAVSAARRALKDEHMKVREAAHFALRVLNRAPNGRE